jgi:hypothetical protein
MQQTKIRRLEALERACPETANKVDAELAFCLLSDALDRFAVQGARRRAERARCRSHGVHVRQNPSDA